MISCNVKLFAFFPITGIIPSFENREEWRRSVSKNRGRLNRRANIEAGSSPAISTALQRQMHPRRGEWIVCKNSRGRKGVNVGRGSSAKRREKNFNAPVSSVMKILADGGKNALVKSVPLCLWNLLAAFFFAR